MPAFQDLTGQRFGRLTVIERDFNYQIEHNITSKETYWKCLCDCGEQKSIARSSLTSNRTKSCGCLKKDKNKELRTQWLDDLTGKRFGKLIVLEQDLEYSIEHNLTTRAAYWKCLCDCGNQITIQGTSLKRGATQSCGCISLKKDLIGQQFGELTVIAEAPARDNDKHAFWKCKCSCGRESEVASSALVGGRIQSCGCAKSIGEQNIIKCLQENNINFETQKTFTDLLNPTTNYNLRFDFYLPDHCRLIEFNGEQHYKSVSYWGGEEKFQLRQQLDEIKNQYALSNKIDLIRIPYWGKNNITLDLLLNNKYLVRG